MRTLTSHGPRRRARAARWQEGPPRGSRLRSMSVLAGVLRIACACMPALPAAHSMPAPAAVASARHNQQQLQQLKEADALLHEPGQHRAHSPPAAVVSGTNVWGGPEPPSTPVPAELELHARNAALCAGSQAHLQLEGAGDEGDGTYAYVKPYEACDAIVLGAVSDKEQAAFEAEYEYGDGAYVEVEHADGDAVELDTSRVSGGAGGLWEGETGGRALLMRRPKKKKKNRFNKRKASRYPSCPKCTVLNCKRKSIYPCSGKCKKKGRLYDCVTRADQKTCQRGGEPWLTRPDLLEADALHPQSAVLVTANVPYIGCANITGLPTGCPAPSTPGATSRRFKLLGSYCEQKSYHLEECESPHFPFGYCMCQYEFKTSKGRKRVRTIPCSSVGMGLQLDEARAPAVGDGPDTLLSDLRVSVRRDGAYTFTRFHDYGDENEGPTYTYSHQFKLNRRPDVNVKLEFYFTYFTLAIPKLLGDEYDSEGRRLPAPVTFTTVGHVLPEYEDDPETIAYVDVVEDYYFVSYRFDSFQECLYECYFAGGDVLGSVGEDYYTVTYTSTPDCPQCYEGGEEETTQAGNHMVTTFSRKDS